MAASDRQSFLQNPGGLFGLGGLKKIDTKKYQYLSSMINFEQEVTIKNVSELTKEVSFYEYGPLITIYELDDFVKKLLSRQKDMAKLEKEVFFYLYHILNSNTEEKDSDKPTPKRVLDTSILAFKYPFCFIIKFGCTDELKYVMHFDNGVYYNLEKKTSLKYEEAHYCVARSNWLKMMKERENEVNSILEFQAAEHIKDILNHQKVLNQKIVENTQSAIECSTELKEMQDQRLDLQKKLNELSKTRDESFMATAQLLDEHNRERDKTTTKKTSTAAPNMY